MQHSIKVKHIITVKTQYNQSVAMKRDLQQAAFEFMSGYAIENYPDRGRYTIPVNNSSVAPYRKQSIYFKHELSTNHQRQYRSKTALVYFKTPLSKSGR